MSTVLAVTLAFLGLISTLVIAIALSLVSSEARGSVPSICKRLLDRTAARLPEEIRDRREEWESELHEAKERPISQLVIAVRIWNSGRSLVREANATVAQTEASGETAPDVGAAGFVKLLALLGRPAAASLNRFAALGSRFAQSSIPPAMAVSVTASIAVVVAVQLLRVLGRVEWTSSMVAAALLVAALAKLLRRR